MSSYREELKNARRLILARIAELHTAFDSIRSSEIGDYETVVDGRCLSHRVGWEELGASVAEYIRAEEAEEASLPPIPEFRPHEPLTTLEKELLAEGMRYLDDIASVIAQSSPKEVAKMLARLRGARPI